MVYLLLQRLPNENSSRILHNTNIKMRRRLKQVMYSEIISFNPLLHICDKITICQRTNIKALGEKAEDSLHLMLGFDVGHRYMQGKRSKGRDENYRIDNTNHITNTMGAKDLTLQ